MTLASPPVAMQTVLGPSSPAILLHQPVNQRGVTVIQARFDRAHGRLSNDLARLPQIDARQPGGALEQRIG